MGVLAGAGGLLGTWTGAGTPGKSFGPDTVKDVAVDNSVLMGDEARGDVYVATASQSEQQQNVVDVFDPATEKVAGEEPLVVAQIKGTCPAVGEVCAEGSVIPFALTGSRKVAVDESNGEVAISDGKVVDLFKATTLNAYEYMGQVTGTPAGSFEGQVGALAIDGSEGDLYVQQEGGGVVDEFTAEGAYLGHIIETPEGGFTALASVAVDEVTHEVYVGDVGPEGGVVDVFAANGFVASVETGAAVAGLDRARLEGVVDPEGTGEATCGFAWGETESLGQFAGCEERVPNGASGVVVHAEIAGGLQPDKTYYYRLQATNVTDGVRNPGEAFQTKAFTTLGVGIREESAADVAATSVTLEATVNPNTPPAAPATSVYFEYGRSSEYETQVPAAPGVSIGSGEEAVEVPAQHVQGLSPGTLYHFRLVALSVVEGKPETFTGPDQTFTTQSAGGFVLADQREWEMVSPAQKRGALIETRLVQGVIQSAAGGEAFTYFTDEPTEAEAAGYSRGVQVLSTRGGAGSSSWQSRDIATPHQQITGAGLNFGEEYRFFSEDLSIGIVHPIGAFTTTLSPEASEQTAYLRSDFTGGNHTMQCVSSCYQPLVTGCPAAPGACPQSVQEHANVPPGTSFGETGACPGPPGNRRLFCGPEFVGATPDGKHIILNSNTALSRTPTEVNGLYEWSQGSLALVSVLPASEAKQPGEAAKGTVNLGYGDGAARHAVSDDGSRVIWEAQPNGKHHLYMRDMATGQTVRLDAVQGGSGSGGLHPRFQVASSDGSKVYFTDTQQLTGDAGAVGETWDLYECEMVEEAGRLACRLSDLTPLVGRRPAAVQGAVVGASEDGSWVYFVADGVLENNGVPVPGALHGSCNEVATATSPGTQCNLYARHDGITRLAARLSGADFPDWAGTAGEELGQLTARVSPDGRWLAFMSQRELTGYDNHDALSGQPDEEAYLYNGENEHLACVSCQPTGARPTGQEYGPPNSGSMPFVGEFNKWESTSWLAADLPAWTRYGGVSAARYQSRYLSNSGRMFFNSDDALVPQDGDGTWDVYEYEPPGTGSCTTASSTYSEHSQGCVNLISSGDSREESAFFDAGENGNDIFFITSEKLSPTDTDTALDIYDAHQCTTTSPCFPPPAEQPPPCATPDSCRQAPTPQPEIFGAPPSATFTAPNQPTTPPPATKPKTAAQIRAAKLAKALKACRKEKSRARRKHCESQAHKHYNPPHKTKHTTKATKTSDKPRSR